MATLEKFVRDFEEILEADEGSLTPGTALEDLEGWDSVNKLAFMVYVDESYGVEVDPDAVVRCLTVEDLFVLVRPSQAA
ncbi:MAG: acyl carrier protein [Alphaproteobacteria bacterium]